jgi:AraC-like DNA-binding protein
MQDMPDELHKMTDIAVVPSLTLRSAGMYQASKGQHYPQHQHSSYELIVYLSGAAKVTIATETVDAYPGMVLIIPPKALHFDTAVAAYSQYYLRISASRDLTLTPLAFDDINRTITQLAEQLVREYQGTQTYKSRMISLLLEQLELTLLRQRSANLPDKAELLIRQVEQHIDNHYARSFRIQDVLGSVAASPSTIRNHFATRRGYSPKQYLHQVRLRRVFELLRETDLNLEEIAQLTGFDSASHLSRRVKQATGHPPGHFRC